MRKGDSMCFLSLKINFDNLGGKRFVGRPEEFQKPIVNSYLLV
jgi:hypothetical protein